MKQELFAKVKITGFSASCPKFIFKEISSGTKAVINDSESIILAKLLTNSILRSFVNVKMVSCGLDHCIAITVSG